MLIIHFGLNLIRIVQDCAEILYFFFFKLWRNTSKKLVLTVAWNVIRDVLFCFQYVCCDRMMPLETCKDAIIYIYICIFKKIDDLKRKTLLMMAIQQYNFLLSRACLIDLVLVGYFLDTLGDKHDIIIFYLSSFYLLCKQGSSCYIIPHCILFTFTIRLNLSANTH